MPDAISQMTPLLPERADDLQDLALEVIQHSASLGTRQHPITLHTLRELLPTGDDAAKSLTGRNCVCAIG
jgi:hypothetical protein